METTTIQPTKIFDLKTLKIEKQERVSQLIKECKVFLAFSDKQFEEHKTPKHKDEIYVSFGAGTYLPKSQLQNWLDGLNKISEWYGTEIKNNKLRRQHIVYELNNYECFYSGDITDALDALGSNYTKEEVQNGFNKERKKYQY